MKKILIVLGCLFLLGCEAEEITLESLIREQEFIQDKSEVENFSLNEVNFSLFIPKDFLIVDSSKGPFKAIVIHESKKDYRLHITAHELKDKNFEDIKKSFIHSDVKTKIDPWLNNGYEIFYFAYPKIKVDRMIRNNRIFIYPGNGRYLVLTEIVSDINDPSISDEIKKMADSLKLF